MISMKLFEELYKNVDYSIIGKENTVLEEVSGVKYVNMIIEKHLGKFTQEYFFEYSSIGSTINIEKKELYCFSAVKGSNHFKERLSKYAQPVINRVFGDVKYNWFHNPQLFIAPTINSISPFVNKKNTSYPDLSKFGIDIDKIMSDVDSEESDINDSAHQISSDGNLFITDLRYKRSFDIMLESSKAIFERYNGSEELLTVSYHGGAEMLRACYDKILDIQEEDTYYYVTFPIISARNSRASELYSSLYNKNEMLNRVQGTGHFFLYFKIDNFIEEEIYLCIQRLYCEINLVLNFLSLNYIFNSALDLYAQSQKESIKSAKAAIMSRNMSHNLGSHVMAYLKQRLNSVEDIIKENSLASIIKNNSIAGNSSDDYEILNVLLKSINSGEAIDTQQEVELPFLVGLGKFINYIQERQDFIATIATSYIPYTSPVNFKDAIYDELNPDLRHLRHKERSGHKPDNILLAYIAKSEGLERTNFDGVEDKFFEDNNDIIIRFRDFKGLIPSTGENSINAISSLEQMKTYDFALPGGTIGRQALFSIIENIIRNAAKHGSRKQNQNLELSIDILDLAKDGESIVEMSKYDTGYPLQVPQGKELNKGVVDDIQQLSLPLDQLLATKYSTAKDIENLYIISITDNLPLINNLKKEESEQKFLELVNAVKAGYIDNETGKMDNTCKGLKEIRISAAWLRGIVDEDVDPLNNAPIVTVRAAKDKTGEYHLQYLICVQKPRKVAVVTADELEIFSDSNKSKLKFINAGWRFFTAKEWVNANRSFEIILAEKELCTTDFKTQAPDRLVESTKDQIEKVISASEQLYEGDSSGYEMAYAYLWNLLLKERNRITKEYYQIEKGGRFAIDTNVKNEDIIYIEDGRSFNELKDRETSEDGCYRILSNGKVKVYNDVGTAFRAVSLFRTHHGLDQQCNLGAFFKFKFNNKLKNKRYTNTTFVEGITGHNSTDRLIRNKFIDDIWYFKQANAIKTKIAIFDERVFKKITNLSDDVIIEEFAKSNSASILTNEKATLMTQKGIYVLNIIENKHVTHHEFLIFGIDDLSAEYKDGIPETRVKAKLIGRIEAGEGDEVIQIKYENDCKEYFNSHMFDYVTIHQGLLDKLYNKLGASERKNKVTEILKEHFVKHSENNGFVIHSGRSRPSLKDMPQKVPFIQFAAIDTAIFDSKSTFVELLNFAYYEENNS